MPQKSAAVILALAMHGQLGGSQAPDASPTTNWDPPKSAELHSLQSDGRESVAERSVTLSFDNVSLEYALMAIEKSANVSIAYGDVVVPLRRNVSLRANHMPVLTALREILKGTAVQVKLSPAGKIILFGAATPAQRAQRGAVAGIVTDAQSGKILASAQVAIEGTKLIVATDRKGQYVITQVPSGTYVITARLLGYSMARKPITVIDNDTVTVNLAMTAIPTRLQEVVTTGAGDRRRLEVGNSIASIDAASIVPTTPLRNLSDLLQSRAPGVQVLSNSGTVGSGSRIRIRGISSILANSDPIVIIDGVRADAANSTPGATTYLASTSENLAGGADIPAMSRLNDIDLEMIESIEVLKGPSASTLYGSDAANGVIVIKTKRGRPGPTRWSFSTTQGMSTMKATFMDAWRSWGVSESQPALAACTLAAVAAKYCTQDSVTHYNPLNYDATSPFGTGHTSRYNAQVSGGSTQLRYFLGGSYDDETGFLKMPSSEATRLIALRNGTALPDWARRPNIMNGVHFNGNLNADVSPTADVAMNIAVVNQFHRDARQGFGGIVGQSFVSAGYRDTIGHGWGTTGPGDSFLPLHSDNIKRLTGGVNGNIRPSPALQGHATLGVDQSNRLDESLLRNVDVVGSQLSTRARNDIQTLVKTADLGATISTPITARVRLRSSVGGQYTRQDEKGATLTGLGLVAGSDLINNATTIYAAEMNSASATAGWYIDESAAFDERLFFTVATRGDAGSSFGRAAKALVYPKFNGSWLLSQESFFPKNRVLTNARLRAAFGQAGVQPSVDARFRSYRAGTVFVDSAIGSGILVSTIGNTALRPERSSEFEGGADIGLWSDRFTLEATMYRKFTRNALVTRDLPPSLGLPTRQENIGAVENRGFEATAQLRPMTTDALDWNLTIGLSKNSNKLVTLGNSSMQTSMAQQTRYAEGYPIDGFWARAILGYADANNDGIISASEVQLTDSALYVGQPLPKTEMSFHNDLSFLKGRVTVAAGFSYSAGATQYNAALWNQCQSERCRFLNDPNTTFAQQAIAANAVVSTVLYGAYEHVSWVRWNDLSLSVIAPSSVTRLLRGRTATVAVMGRNLGLWSNYRGADPEVNNSPLGNSTRDAGGIPQPRDWSIRVNLNY